MRKLEEPRSAFGPGLSPSERSVFHLVSLGYTVDVVEWRDRWQHTHDLFGFLDLVCLRQRQTLGVQVTSANNANARFNKITASPRLAAVEAAGWRVVVHGWRSDGRLREMVVLEGNLDAGWPEQLELPWVNGVTP